MLLSVAREKRDAGAADSACRDDVARIAKRRFDGYLPRVLEQRIEAGPADDCDIRNVLDLDRSSLYSKIATTIAADAAD